VNVPIGIVALGVIATAFRAPTEMRRHAMDYLGAALLAADLTAIVLFTSLGGTTWPWASPQILGLIVLSIVLLPAFIVVERRAEEPILPLSLFRNRTFATTSAVGFIVGFALFGAVTFLPLYLQITKGSSPTRSGLELTPLMAGVLITSIVSGNAITRWGRYRPFPIAGTALMTVGLFLLSRLEVGTPTWEVLGAGVVLGLGLGMVMQVLVLAVQNSVDPREMGVATSGSTLFRQIGGSIGVSIFGAIFANRLNVEVAARLPANVRAAPQADDPSAIRALPPAARSLFEEAFAAALHPVFLTAAGVSLVAFALAWLIPAVPLRESVTEVPEVPPGAEPVTPRG
jgi:MFS family permease